MEIKDITLAEAESLRKLEIREHLNKAEKEFVNKLRAEIGDKAVHELKIEFNFPYGAIIKAKEHCNISYNTHLDRYFVGIDTNKRFLDAAIVAKHEWNELQKKIQKDERETFWTRVIIAGMCLAGVLIIMAKIFWLQ